MEGKFNKNSSECVSIDLETRGRDSFKVVPFEWYCPPVELMVKQRIERCPLVVTNIK